MDTDNGYRKLGANVIINALYFPQRRERDVNRQFLLKETFILESKLFEIITDALFPDIPNFDIKTFRGHCLKRLYANYDSVEENRKFKCKVATEKKGQNILESIVPKTTQ